MRKAVEPWLPTGALDKRKIGFQLPFRDWFRGDFSDFAREAWHEQTETRTLTGRGAARIRRVARTLADLDNAPEIEPEHVMLSAYLRDDVP